MNHDMTVKSSEEIAERGKTSNRDLISFTIKVMELSRGTDLDDIDGLRDRFLRYLELCAKCDMKVGNMGAYLAMGIDKRSAERWAAGGVKNKEKVEFMRWVMSVCAQYREAMMSEGTLKEITGIFWQKSFDGFRDNAPIKELPQNTLEREMNADEILEKYADLPED